MLVAIVILYLFLIIPFNVGIETEYKDKKVFLKAKLFGCLSVIKLKIRFLGDGISVTHGRKNKEIKYGDLLFGKKIKLYGDVFLSKISLNIKIGTEDFFIAFITALFIRLANFASRKIFLGVKPYLKTCASTEIYTDKNLFEAFLCVRFYLNVLTIICTLIKFVIGKIVK